MPTPWVLWPLVGAGAVAAADQSIKAVILATKPHLVLIPGFLTVDFATNTGAAFSILRGYPRALTILGILVLAGLFGYLWQKAGTVSRIERSALSLLMGGAIGNLVDRLRLGYVVDYIDVFIGQYHWPMFNLADSAICVGGASLLVVSVRSRPVPPAPARGTPPEVGTT